MICLRERKVITHGQKFGPVTGNSVTGDGSVTVLPVAGLTSDGLESIPVNGKIQPVKSLLGAPYFALIAQKTQHGAPGIKP